MTEGLYPGGLEAHSRATVGTAKGFLGQLVERMPFPAKAIQAQFEQSCAERGIRPFVLPSHSPKLNGRLELAQRNHMEEFRAYHIRARPEVREPSAPPLGAASQHDSTTQFAWQKDAGAVYSGVFPQPGPGGLIVA